MKKRVLALAISSCFLVACSDSDSPQATTSNEVLEIKAIDGYLRNALVWLDINRNYVLDEGEPTARSGENGLTSLDVSEIDDYQTYSVVVQAIKGETIDEDEPNKTINYDFVMTAPAGETNITPLTTLVKINMDTTGAQKEQALAEVSKLVGVDEDKLMSDYTDTKEVANKAKNLVEAGVMPETVEEALVISETDNYLTETEEVTKVVAVIQELEADEVIITDGEDYQAITDSGDGDRDNDGYNDDNDAFPMDSSEWLDTDDDGMGDNRDAFPEDPTETTDSDGDGVGDNSDAFPLDPTETLDSDKDGVGDNSDAFPFDPTETLDSDKDGVGDNSDAFPLDPSETLDSDNDGVGDNSDAFPLNPSETLDSDNDGVGDNSDAFPLNPSETLDSDNDGVGDNSDAFPLDPEETLDSDQDGVGDNEDAFPENKDETHDYDEDGVGDNEDLDDDNDRIADTNDNCPLIANADQKDYDNDGIGDVCDSEELATFDNAIFDTSKWL